MPFKSPPVRKKKPATRYTQEEVDALIKQAYKNAGNPLPSPARRRKMMEQMQQETMDRRMREAAKRTNKK